VARKANKQGSDVRCATCTSDAENTPRRLPRAHCVNLQSWSRTRSVLLGHARAFQAHFARRRGTYRKSEEAGNTPKHENRRAASSRRRRGCRIPPCIGIRYIACFLIEHDAIPQGLTGSSHDPAERPFLPQGEENSCLQCRSDSNLPPNAGGSFYRILQIMYENSAQKLPGQNSTIWLLHPVDTKARPWEHHRRGGKNPRSRERT